MDARHWLGGKIRTHTPYMGVHLPRLGAVAPDYAGFSRRTRRKRRRYREYRGYLTGIIWVNLGSKVSIDQEYIDRHSIQIPYLTFLSHAPKQATSHGLKNLHGQRSGEFGLPGRPETSDTMALR